MYPIQVFVTGGTFDKEYDFINGILYFKNTHLPDMFQRGRCILDIDVKTLMMIDSLEMKEEDRKYLLEQIEDCPTEQIIVTHGTDTMVETAKYLAKEGLAKTIVITGAMIPYAFGTSSDGFFNLGAALAFVQSKPAGVYISMNGYCFDWDNVRKNKKTGYFEALKAT
ncbi:MAG: asparaginase [Saprospiraceae bacterium]|nr:asparaginase [Saprospiraceae bacterium]